MQPRSLDPVDLHVGFRLRQRRNSLGLSQKQLGKELGISFQQVQKYENGNNRMGASRLWQAAEALHVDISFFFFGLQNVGSEYLKQEGDLSNDEIRTVKSLRKIRDDNARKKISDMVQAFAKIGEEN